jgi:hypothetical protein
MAPLLTLIAAPLVLGALPGRMVHSFMAAPLFLLLAQLFMESTTEAAPRDWAALVRILNPLGFNAFRLLPLAEWVSAAATLAQLAGDAPLGARLFVYWALLLGVVNAALWVGNLFGFLTLVALPKYLDERRFAT